MQFVSYQSPTGPRAALAHGGNYIDVNAVDPTLPTTLKGLIALGQDAVKKAGETVRNGMALPAGIKILAPIPDPQKVICVGLNYADHAKESGVSPPDEPVFFSKFPTAVAAHGDSIVLPKVSTQVDYEAELVVVIGRGGKNIPKADAMSHVAGYAPGHDVSARDWQLNKPGKQWLLGKTFDTFAPYGPLLTTPDEAGDPNNLRIALRLNGTTMQDSSTAQLIFKIDELVSYISNVVTLMPGDIIFTGTPPGVGAARKPPVFMKPGDTVEVEIQNLGTLSNPCVGQ